MTPAQELRERGVVARPRLFDADMVAAVLQPPERRARRRDAGRVWTRPDGVTKHEAFSPVIFHAPLLAAVRELIGDGTCFLQPTDLRVGRWACA